MSQLWLAPIFIAKSKNAVLSGQISAQLSCGTAPKTIGWLPSAAAPPGITAGKIQSLLLHTGSLKNNRCNWKLKW